MINNNRLWFESYKVNFDFSKTFQRLFTICQFSKTFKDLEKSSQISKTFKDRTNPAICSSSTNTICVSYMNKLVGVLINSFGGDKIKDGKFLLCDELFSMNE